MSIGEPLSETELCPPELLAEQEEAFARDVARLRARSQEFVDVPCPACGAAHGAAALEKWGFRWLECGGCRTLYMSPRPSPAVMASYYAASENYRYWAEVIFPASEDARREKIHRPWVDRVSAYCKRFGVPFGTLVEIGPGFGTFGTLAREHFRRVVAIEPTPELVEACRSRGLEVIAKRVEDVGDELAGVDVVVAFEVIEHLFDPRPLLERALALLAPGGLLVLSCPNGRGFDIQFLGAASQAIDPEHVNLFNPDSLGLLVASAGFEIVEVSTPGRLDVELAHDAIASGAAATPSDPILRRVLVDEYDRLAWPFQQFLAEHRLSSHMWLAAVRPVAASE